MSISLIVYGVGAIVLIGMIAAMFRAINAPKVEVENTKQEQEDTKQTVVKGETREDIIKARLATRSQRRWWRLGRRDPMPQLPETLPKPNRPL